MMKNSFKRILLLSAVTFFALAASSQVEILVNQVGYYPHASKFAAVKGRVSSDDYVIVSTITRDTVYRGKLEIEKVSNNSSSVLRLIDFSSFATKGKYFISIPHLTNSYLFTIGDSVLEAPSKALLKGFYYQRSNTSLESQFAGLWARQAGHPDTAVLIHSSASSKQRPEGTVVSSAKGWYDAGDYNKYIVNSGITMGTLLSAYEDFPHYFSLLKTSIPESSDNVPDLLNEIIYNLRWMLTMQDPNDGGVYHKCTNAAFDGMVMPGVTKLPRYLVQKSTAATLDFTAVMAQASRVLKKFSTELPGLGDSCANAAVTAWKWSLKNPAVIYNQRVINSNSKPAITTGDYGDRNVMDEWLWAATEMSINSADGEFDSVVLARINDSLSLASWGNVGMLSYFSLLRITGALRPPLSKARDQMRTSILRMADQFVDYANESPLRTVMGKSQRDFVWGSNAVAANQGMLLINAYLITGKAGYLNAALLNMDYLLGRNCTGYCFITGIGTRQPMHPHHRPSEADGILPPVPGLLVGGPNPGRQDSCQYPVSEPELAYIDSVCSYASNEIAINWNAPAVYLANALNALSERFASVR